MLAGALRDALLAILLLVCFLLREIQFLRPYLKAIWAADGTTILCFAGVLYLNIAAFDYLLRSGRMGRVSRALDRKQGIDVKVREELEGIHVAR